MDSMAYHTPGGTIHQTLWTPPGTMGTADTGKPYTRHYGHQKVPWTPWVLQTTGKQTPYTKDTTRYRGNHGHSRHQGTIQNTLWSPLGTMGTADTREPYTRHYGHHQAPWALHMPGETMHHTLWTPPSTTDTMGNAYTREEYTRH